VHLNARRWIPHTKRLAGAAPKIHLHSLTLEPDPKIDVGWRQAVSRGAAVHSFRKSGGTGKISALRENVSNAQPDWVGE
jgi:hypothetical protein